MHVQIVLRISVFSNLLKMLFISIRRDTAVVFTLLVVGRVTSELTVYKPSPPTLVRRDDHLEVKAKHITTVHQNERGYSIPEVKVVINKIMESRALGATHSVWSCPTSGSCSM